MGHTVKLADQTENIDKSERHSITQNIGSEPVYRWIFHYNSKSKEESTSIIFSFIIWLFENLRFFFNFKTNCFCFHTCSYA